ncbi:MAG: GNAT family protein [Candidatus Aenigmatarchaeota archaeon]
MKYIVLKRNIFRKGDYWITPLREKDIHLIREWRNKQILILRQNKYLTKEEQINYYNNVVIPSFSQHRPNLILFSFLYKNKCIGYGGLVHIDWDNKRAEMSFLTNPKIANNNVLYEFKFNIFIHLIKKVAFEELKLNKIYTETFDIRPHHISILEKNGFRFEGRLRQHVYKGRKYLDSLIHSILRREYELERQKNIC